MTDLNNLSILRFPNTNPMLQTENERIDEISQDIPELIEEIHRVAGPIVQLIGSIEFDQNRLVFNVSDFRNPDEIHEISRSLNHQNIQMIYETLKLWEEATNKDTWNSQFVLREGRGPAFLDLMESAMHRYGPGLTVAITMIASIFLLIFAFALRARGII